MKSGHLIGAGVLSLGIMVLIPCLPCISSGELLLHFSYSGFWPALPSVWALSPTHLPCWLCFWSAVWCWASSVQWICQLETRLMRELKILISAALKICLVNPPNWLNSPGTIFHQSHCMPIRHCDNIITTVWCVCEQFHLRYLWKGDRNIKCQKQKNPGQSCIGAFEITSWRLYF